TAKARMKLVGDARAANHLAPLEHKRFQSRLGEIVCSDQTVVAGADDDYGIHKLSVFSEGRTQNSKLKTQNLSFRIAIAAFRPLAPMMPPPGCVAEPHM